MPGMAPARPPWSSLPTTLTALAHCPRRPRSDSFPPVSYYSSYRPVMVNPRLHTPARFSACKSPLNVRPVDPDTPVVIISDGEQRPSTFRPCASNYSYSLETSLLIYPYGGRKYAGAKRKKGVVRYHVHVPRRCARRRRRSPIIEIQSG
jgi:hypothetical protein